MGKERKKSSRKKPELGKLFDEWFPIVGIVVFAMCSWQALANMLHQWSGDDSWVYDVGAGAVEVYSAYTVTKIVTYLRIATASISRGMNKEKRRFGRWTFVAFVMLVVPSFAVSYWANKLEFGSVWLGLLFPSLAIACAAAVVLPEVYRAKVAELEQGGSKEEQEPAPPKQPKAFVKHCEVAGCTFTTEPKPTEFQAKKALSGHMRKHGGKKENA